MDGSGLPDPLHSVWIAWSRQLCVMGSPKIYAQPRHHSNGGDRGALAVRTRRLWEGLKIGAMLNQADRSADQRDAGGANHNAVIKPQCWG
jgi:hypothetical protein